ncbi:MAG: uncharacterized protein PWQ55_622 [Chloroflexota bacterium]|nr:uncharacterized protein [Chloroflexota bacterium]
MTEHIENRRVLISGASSGIGASLAAFLAAKGLTVFLTARREERLEALCTQIRAQGGKADYLAGDISQADFRARLMSAVTEKGPLDILVNNAGFGWYGYYAQMQWQDAHNLLAVNVEALVHLTRLALPDMLARKSGHIINIGSVAGGLPNQGIAMYAASKAFVDAFTTGLYRELRGSGVSASVMRLGPIQTEFYEQARSLKNGGAVPAERFAIPTERVNRALWRLLRRPRRAMYVPGWLYLSRWVEPLFGALIDPLGPLLLKRQDRS